MRLSFYLLSKKTILSLGVFFISVSSDASAESSYPKRNIHYPVWGPVVVGTPGGNTYALTVRYAKENRSLRNRTSNNAWHVEAGQDFGLGRLRIETGFGYFLNWTRHRTAKLFYESGGLRFGYLYENGKGGGTHLGVVTALSYWELIQFRIIIPMMQNKNIPPRFELGLMLHRYFLEVF